MPEIADRVPEQLTRYCRLLAEQLRLAGMPERRVRGVVQDVLAHVAATREDPVEAFGQPADYAAQWVRPPSAGAVAVRMLATGLAYIGIWAGTRAVLVGGPWGGRTDVYWSDVTVAATMVAFGAVLPWTVGRVLNRRAARRVGTGQRPGDTLLRLVATGVVLAVLMVVGSRVVPEWNGSTVLFAAPRWLMLVAGLAGVLVFFGVRSPEGRSMPRPPTDDRSLRTRWQAFTGTGTRRP